ncbi:MAG: hypothetical protein N3D10_03310 [Candidatus Micrarchaeota archaeon]|nr:hypothetical protein [Candidatus Micrarchaeota archaeon]
MNLKIESKLEEPLYQRTKLTFLVTFDGPIPKKEQIKSSLAAVLAVSPENLILHPFRVSVGKQELRATAYLYPSKDIALKYEKKYILIRNGLLAKEQKQQKAKKPTKS